MATQDNATSRCTIQAIVEQSVLDEIDALHKDLQAKAIGRTVRRAEVVRELVLIGLKEKTRRMATTKGGA